MLRKIMKAVLLLALAALLSGCSSKEKEDGEYYIYYKNVDDTKLVTSLYEPQSDNDYEIINELLEQLTTNPQNTNMVNSLPEDVKVLNTDLEQEILTINFSKEYNNLNGSGEVLCRAAVVLTLGQVDSVDYVVFHVDGENITDSKGEIIEAMQASDFVDNIGGNINTYEKVKFTLYYANEEGNKLIPYTYETKFSSDTLKEEYIVEKLLEGPKEDGYYRTISDSVKLVSISTSDGVCYVNLSSEFLTENPGVTDEVTIYSIVNSLSELSYITRVQISVNGSSDVSYHDNLSLSEAYTRNLDCVE
ncbi:MAG: GerMN domain-containing protein [Eubacterium sp.]